MDAHLQLAARQAAFGNLEILPLANALTFSCTRHCTAMTRPPATGLSLLPVSVYKDPIVTITIVNDSKENETKKFGVGKPVVIWY